MVTLDATTAALSPRLCCFAHSIQGSCCEIRKLGMVPKLQQPVGSKKAKLDAVAIRNDLPVGSRKILWRGQGNCAPVGVVGLASTGLDGCNRELAVPDRRV